MTTDRLRALLAEATSPIKVRRYPLGGGRVSDAATGRHLVADFYSEADREAWISAFNALPALLAVADAAQALYDGFDLEHGITCGPDCRCGASDAEARLGEALAALGKEPNP